MVSRIKKLGIVIAVLGVIFVAGGVFAFVKVQEGTEALQAFSAAQNVTLSYDEDGQLVDRGDPEQAKAILSLLEDDWKYPVNYSELDPNDPIVNTGSEYMYQMATINFHILHGTQTVVLTEDVESNGKTYPAGEYTFEVDGRYWTDFDRSNPIEAKAREQAWTGTAHGLIGELGVGSVTASTLQLGLGTAAIIGGLGGTLILTGLGLIWAVSGDKMKEPVKAEVKAPAKKK